MVNNGRYIRVKSRFWDDEKVINWSEELKYLALFLITCKHNNILGCYVMPKLYICSDLGWSEERLAKPFQKLIDEGFIKYDETNRLLLVVNYLEHNPIENGNQGLAAKKVLMELPRSLLLQDLKRFIEQLNKPFLKQLAEQIGEPVTVTVTVTETVLKEIPKDKSPQLPKKKKTPKSVSSYTPEFETFWQQYPVNIDKKKAFEAWQKRLKEGVTVVQIMAATKCYVHYAESRGYEYRHPRTFLNSDLEEMLSLQEVKPNEKHSGHSGRNDGKPVYTDGSELYWSKPDQPERRIDDALRKPDLP